MGSTVSKRLFGLILCLLGIVAAGCSGFDWVTSWSPFGPKPTESLPGVPSPAQRTEELRSLAKNAESSNEAEKRQVVVQLSQTLQNEQDPLIRAEILRALAAYPSVESDRLLRAAMNDPDADVRVVVCEIWATRGNADAATVLGTVLETDSDIDVRLSAARALGEIEDPAAVNALGKALEDVDPAMQYRAVVSLRRITGEDLGNDVNAWRQYVKGELPQPEKPVSIAERLRRLF
jgi:HEAT repeat protein